MNIYDTLEFNKYFAKLSKILKNTMNFVTL